MSSVYKILPQSHLAIYVEYYLPSFLPRPLMEWEFYLPTFLPRSLVGMGCFVYLSFYPGEDVCFQWLLLDLSWFTQGVMRHGMFVEVLGFPRSSCKAKYNTIGGLY